jgi:copper oxidase (laccase) domain-containing protein
MAHNPGAGAAFVQNPRGRWQCDLYLLARQRLKACGVNDISGGGLCTYADPARFYSYRRDVQHQGMATTGRMATLIWIESAP